MSAGSDSCLEEELANARFLSSNPIWIIVASFLGTEETAVTLGHIPELKGIAEYTVALDESKHARNLLEIHKSYGGPFSDLVCSDNDVLYSFGAGNMGFEDQENFRAFCRKGNIDPFSDPEKRFKCIREGLSLVYFETDTFYSKDKKVAFTCSENPRKKPRAIPGYLEVIGLRRRVKAQEERLRKAGVGETLCESGNVDEVNKNNERSMPFAIRVRRRTWYRVPLHPLRQIAIQEEKIRAFLCDAMKRLWRLGVSMVIGYLHAYS